MSCNWLCRTCGEEIERIRGCWNHVSTTAVDGSLGHDHSATPDGPEFYTVRVNGDTVVLDGESFDEGLVRLASFAMGEQCEDCGVDVLEGCEVAMVKPAQGKPWLSSPYRIKCQCGAVYDCKPARMVNDWVTDLEET